MSEIEPGGEWPRLWDLDDIVAVGDLARELRVGPGAIVNWRTRYPDFPKPLRVLRAASLYSRRQVLECLRRNNNPNVPRETSDE